MNNLLDNNHLEVEVKHNGNEIDCNQFKILAESLKPTKFIYAESRDVYYVREGDDFLRHRHPSNGSNDPRSELTFKKKHSSHNNIVRTEVNIRVDLNDINTVDAFCEGLGYKRSFSVYKICHIYYYEGGNLVFYSVIDENNKVSNFLEIEAIESNGDTKEKSLEFIQKYEKLLAPLGITPQKRLKKSLFEIYRKN